MCDSSSFFGYIITTLDDLTFCKESMEMINVTESLTENIGKVGGENDYRDSKTSQVKSISRVYADVLASKPNSYYEYDNFSPTLEEIDNYSLIRKLGHGKYSIVFEGLQNEKNERVVIKMLKPVRKRKVKREIKILDCLKGGMNIVKLLAVVSIPHTDLTALVFEQLIHNEDFKNIYLKLSEADTRYYLYEVLRALEYCHSRGIMHRDVKPHNIIVDQENHKIRLIDWGLAEFYHPGQEYNVRVASRYFKGTAELNTYLKKYNISVDGKLQSMLGMHTRKSWQRFVHTEHEYLITDHAINLLESLLRIDHMERISAREALNHKYFSHIRRKIHCKSPSLLNNVLSSPEESP
ncbi:hypothetical protein NQ314_005397 [Rhamnusium bicolor]|uniref:non-specific serine/threonine protein kinase n=1 Tax=Rhamnusium bicolor TaxID=1586634 RepID=A0AAV8ZHJ6_9CUCU|nr:hypothetical protein NQ314_005397 [Rhamnusium bicolor]